ncbi:MAG: extracellular solute-binding protein [Ignavibacteriales bacterium]|nr:extracellular solute-binding protein [Ignavibacteriales bacterium]
MKFEKLTYVLISAVISLLFFFLIFWSNRDINKEWLNRSRAKRIVYVDNISPAHRKVIALFNERYKDEIYVEAINLPFEKFSTNERKELLARFLRTKADRIDVFAVDHIWIPRFAKYAVPLSLFKTKRKTNTIIDEALATCFVHDTLVAMPFYIDIATMHYNKAMLRALPNGKGLEAKLAGSVTWEDLIKLSESFKNKSNFFIFQADDYEGLLCIFTEMMEGLGTPLYSNGKLQITSKAAEAALTFLRDMVHTYKISPPQVAQMKENPSYEYFFKNNGLFLRGWPSMPGYITDAAIETNQMQNMAIAPPPHFKAGKPAAVFGGWNLMVSNYSKYKTESFRFISFLLSEEAQKVMLEEGQVLPVNKHLYQDSAIVQKHPRLPFYRQLFKIGIHRPFLDNYPYVSDVLSYYLNKAIRNEVQPREALRLAEIQINSGSILLK